MERLERKGMERKGKAGLGERAGRDPGRKAGKDSWIVPSLKGKVREMGQILSWRASWPNP